MAAEIERKFLVDRKPPRLSRFPHKEIAQGYLCAGADGSEVRVRRIGTRHVLTVKSSGGLSRRETEVSLSAAAFRSLWPLTKGRRVRKVRFRIRQESLTIEVDVYGGRLVGLIVAEVEFRTSSAARRFRPPPWFGREVTDDPAYKNRRLAEDGRPKGPGAR